MKNGLIKQAIERGYGIGGYDYCNDTQTLFRFDCIIYEDGYWIAKEDL